MGPMPVARSSDAVQDAAFPAPYGWLPNAAILQLPREQRKHAVRGWRMNGEDGTRCLCGEWKMAHRSPLHLRCIERRPESYLAGMSLDQGRSSQILEARNGSADMRQTLDKAGIATCSDTSISTYKRKREGGGSRRSGAVQPSSHRCRLPRPHLLFCSTLRDPESLVTATVAEENDVEATCHSARCGMSEVGAWRRRHLVDDDAGYVSASFSFLPTIAAVQSPPLAQFLLITLRLAFLTLHPSKPAFPPSTSS